MNIVQASSEQSDELTRISIAAKAHWDYTSEVLASWEQALTITPESIDSNLTFIAMLDGSLAGFYQLNLGGPSARLEHLWVLPAYMRKGVGSALLQHAQNKAKANLQIDSDPNAEAFYLAFGARRVERLPAAIPGRPDRFLPRMELRYDPF